MAQGCDLEELPEITGRIPVITGRIPEINWRKMHPLSLEYDIRIPCMLSTESLKYLVIYEKFIVGEPVKYFPDVTSICCKVEICLRI